MHSSEVFQQIRTHPPCNLPCDLKGLSDEVQLLNCFFRMWSIEAHKRTVSVIYKTLFQVVQYLTKTSIHVTICQMFWMMYY